MKLIPCFLLIVFLSFFEIHGYYDSEYRSNRDLESNENDQDLEEGGYEDNENMDQDFDGAFDALGDDALVKRFAKRQASQEFVQTALKLHNDYRARHGSPPLVLDSKLSSDAQAYAESEAAKNVQKHSCSPCDKYGESLANKAGTAPAPTGAAAAQWAVKAWYDEVSLYPFNNPGGGDMHKWGHFTALVWKSTKKVGFGVAYGSKLSKSGNKMNTIYAVARYSPPGNMLTKEAMQENVQPPSRK